MQIIQTNEEIEKAAILLADAFRDYPLYTYLFPEEKARAKLLPLIFKCSIKYASEFTYHLSDGENMQAVLIIDSPQAKGPSFRNIVAIILQHGYKFPLRRSIKMLSIFKEYMDSQPNPPFYYIQSIGISPDYQRMGLGKRCIDFAKKLANRETIYLETNSHTNVDYYKKCGFKLYQNFKTDKGCGPEVWSFVLNNG